MEQKCDFCNNPKPLHNLSNYDGKRICTKCNPKINPMFVKISIENQENEGNFDKVSVNTSRSDWIDGPSSTWKNT